MANKFLYIFIFVLNFSFDSWCQNSEVVTKIYLRNGSIYLGKILDITTNKDYRLQINDSTVLVIPNSSIKKIIQNDRPDKSKIKHSVYAFREKGYYNVNYTSIYAGSAVEDYSTLGFGLSSTLGYMFNKYFGVGLGIGIDKFDFISIKNKSPYADISILSSSPIICMYPLFIETRGYLFGKSTAYYYSMNAGYSFVNKNDDLNIIEATGGLMLHPAIGIRFGGRKHFNFCLDLGVKFQKTNFVIQDFFESGTDHYFLNHKRFILRLGIQI